MNIIVEYQRRIILQIESNKKMILINLLIVSFIALIIIDLIIKCYPKSKLLIKPIRYKIKSNNDFEEVRCEFEIYNSSSNKETMIPSLNSELNFFNKKDVIQFDYKKEILIDYGDSKKNITSYWPTIIVKSNSSVKIYMKFIFKKYLVDNDKFLWLKINWKHYGHFGLKINQNNFLLSNHKTNMKYRKLIHHPINNEYEAIAIKTNILGAFDDPIEIIYKYCEGIIRKDDILVIGETPLAIMQGRYINPKNIDYSFFSKIYCYFFHPTSSLATACGMQLLINKIGITRITLSLLLGSLFKLFKINGIFYRMTGSESSLIDDISGTTTPYDKSIVMGPINPKLYCKQISKVLKINTAVVDVNDLGGVKIVAASNKSIIKILHNALKNNPAGNDDQKTPIVLIRKKHN